MDPRVVNDQACKAAVTFSKLFYNAFDKSRHLLSNLYMTSGNLVWNGISVCGKDEIAKFYQSLPPSEVELRSLDAQPILSEFAEGQTSILVTANGAMRFNNKTWETFAETFILTAEGTVWKIVCDTLRFHGPVPL